MTTTTITTADRSRVAKEGMSRYHSELRAHALRHPRQPLTAQQKRSRLSRLMREAWVNLRARKAHEAEKARMEAAARTPEAIRAERNDLLNKDRWTQADYERDSLLSRELFMANARVRAEQVAA